MRVLIILLFAINLSDGQTIDITHKDFEARDMVGEYSIIWSADKYLILGENLRLKKHKKFEYEVFSAGMNNGWEDAEKILVSGKYLIKDDTLKLTIKNKAHKLKTEIFSFRVEYIVKKFELTSKSNETRKTHSFVCLVPIDKLKVFTTETDHLIENLTSVVIENFDDLNFGMLIGIRRETQQIFWDKRFFIKKE